MSEPTLVVVRGSYRGANPAYVSAAHDTRKNHYVALELQGGRVLERTHYRAAERRALEERMGAYRGAVLADRRADASLLPLTPPETAGDADLGALRRAKSPEELDALAHVADLAFRGLHSTDGGAAFRGVATAAEGGDGMRAAHRVTKRPGFVEYRGGFQTAGGLYSELSRVEARTPAWQARLDRVHAGLDAVERELRVGARVADLDRAFRGHTAADDVVYGSVVHHTGYEPHEADVPLDVVRDGDFLTVGVAVGDGKDTAVVYRSARGFRGPPPAPPGDPALLAKLADAHARVAELEAAPERNYREDKLLGIYRGQVDDLEAELAGGA